MNDDLFKLVPPFQLHSGGTSYWKVECDALSDEELEWFAKTISMMVPPFGEVIGIPSGGLPIAAKLERYCNTGEDTVLIVDDVFTTGNSMESFRKGVQSQRPDVKIVGATMFNRSLIYSDWIRSVWYLNRIAVEKLP